MQHQALQLVGLVNVLQGAYDCNMSTESTLLSHHILLWAHHWKFAGLVQTMYTLQTECKLHMRKYGHPCPSAMTRTVI